MSDHTKSSEALVKILAGPTAYLNSWIDELSLQSFPKGKNFWDEEVRQHASLRKHWTFEDFENIADALAHALDLLEITAPCDDEVVVTAREDLEKAWNVVNGFFETVCNPAEEFGW